MKRIILEGQKLYYSKQGEKIGELIIKSFGQQIPDALKNKIISQFKNMSKEHFETFEEHSIFVNSIHHVRDIVDLSRIRAKLLIVHGENDSLLDSKNIMGVSRIIPNSEYINVKNAGHFLHFEHSDILKTYDSFLSKE
jgi:pimeloyl-ACP methyl ester carboxylesterase